MRPTPTSCSLIPNADIRRTFRHLDNLQSHPRHPATSRTPEKRLRRRQIACSHHVHPTSSLSTRNANARRQRHSRPSSCLHITDEHAKRYKKYPGKCVCIYTNRLTVPTKHRHRTLRRHTPRLSRTLRTCTRAKETVMSMRISMLDASDITTLSLLQNTALGIHATSAPHLVDPTPLSTA